MTLNRLILRNVDDRLRSELDRDKGEWMVKIPVSNATRAVWRRYCDAVGVHMGEALAILLHHELASIADVDLETVRDRLEQRETEIETLRTELDGREGEVERREREVDFKESSRARKEQRLGDRKEELDAREEGLDERKHDLDEREGIVAIAERQLIERLKLLRSLATSSRSRLGRNEPCWCGSKKKYKNCHLDWDKKDS
jgi:Skp family chaperone for outer membrane proteins